MKANRHPLHQPNAVKLTFVEYSNDQGEIIGERLASQSDERSIRKARVEVPIGATQFRFYGILGFEHNGTGKIYTRPDIQEKVYQRYNIGRLYK